MRPAVTEVAEILEWFRADIFDGSEKRFLASVYGIIKATIRHAEPDVTDPELIQMAVGPAEGFLK